jgi:hypothetical protein
MLVTKLGDVRLVTTLYVSNRDWTPRRANAVCRRHGISLTSRGEVIFNGQIVATYELAAGTLVLHGLELGSPLIAALDLRPVE